MSPHNRRHAPEGGFGNLPVGLGRPLDALILQSLGAAGIGPLGAEGQAAVPASGAQAQPVDVQGLFQNLLSSQAPIGQPSPGQIPTFDLQGLLGQQAPGMSPQNLVPGSIPTTDPTLQPQVPAALPGPTPEEELAALQAAFEQSIAPAPQQATPTDPDFTDIRALIQGAEPKRASDLSQEDQFLRILSGLSAGAARGRDQDVGQLIASIGAGGAGAAVQLKGEQRQRTEDFESAQRDFQLQQARTETQLQAQERAAEQFKQQVAFENEKAIAARDQEVASSADARFQLLQIAGSRDIQNQLAQAQLKLALEPNFSAEINGIQLSSQDVPVGMRSAFNMGSLGAAGIMFPGLREDAVKELEQDMKSGIAPLGLDQDPMAFSGAVAAKIMSGLLRDPGLLAQALEEYQESLTR